MVWGLPPPSPRLPQRAAQRFLNAKQMVTPIFSRAPLYLSVQLFHQGDVSKPGINRKDTSGAGVEADVVGDRASLGVSPI